MKQQSASYTGNREEARASATCASARGFFQRKSQYDLKGNGVRNHTANGRRWSAIPPSSSERLRLSGRGILAFSREAEKGFTLLEILIAIFILAIIMTIVLGPFTGIMASSREAERKIDLYQTARSLMDFIAADIRGIFPQPAGDEGYVFKATEERLEGMTTMPRLDFVTTHSLLIGPQRNRFLSEVTYFLRKNPKDEMYTLIRRSESPPSEPFDEGGKEVPLCRIIESFRIQSISEDEATSEVRGEIPRALMIDFTLNLEGEKENFVTMVRPMVAVGALREGIPGLGRGNKRAENLETPKTQTKTAR